MPPWGCGSRLSRGAGRSPPPDGITVLLESPPDSLDDRFALDAPTASGWRSWSRPGSSPSMIQRADAGAGRVLPRADPPTSGVHASPAAHLPRRQRAHGRGREGHLRRSALAGRSRVAARGRYEPIEHVEVVDARTLRFHLKRPYAPLLAELSLGIVPAARAGPEGVALQDRAPMGAGPVPVRVPAGRGAPRARPRSTATTAASRRFRGCTSGWCGTRRHGCWSCSRAARTWW